MFFPKKAIKQFFFNCGYVTFLFLGCFLATLGLIYGLFFGGSEE